MASCPGAHPSNTVDIGAFRVVTTDSTPPEPPPNPQPPPSGGPPPEALTLDLGAKKQKLRKKVKFSATASVASNLAAEGKKIKETRSSSRRTRRPRSRRS